MKFIKKSMALLTMLLMLTANTFAEETKNVLFLATSDRENASEISLTSTNETVDSIALENHDSDLIMNIEIIYNNEYYEGVLIPNNALVVSISISNSGTARELVCYLAEYDSTGRLLELTADNTISVPAGENFAANLTKTFSNSNTTSAKIFLWEENKKKTI